MHPAGVCGLISPFHGQVDLGIQARQIHLTAFANDKAAVFCAFNAGNCTKRNRLAVLLGQGHQHANAYACQIVRPDNRATRRDHGFDRLF